jgi:hypothetical protein
MPMIPRPIQPTFSGKVIMLLDYETKAFVHTVERRVRAIYSSTLP